jgi:farnesyl-diphosphate farnesyltransferase
VNILRDLPVDLRKGRCYLPVTRLAEAGLNPADLLLLENMGRFRGSYAHWLDQAEAHLAAGWRYTNTLPRGQVRVRLACAWPILIGAETLARLRRENVLDPTHRIKVNRPEVRSILWWSVLAYPFQKKWAGLFRGGKAVASAPDIS